MANFFLDRYKLNQEVRFDIIAIVKSKGQLSIEDVADLIRYNFKIETIYTGENRKNKFPGMRAFTLAYEDNDPPILAAVAPIQPISQSPLGFASSCGGPLT